jgi:hypothetical protein
LKKLQPDPVALLLLLERWREGAITAGHAIKRIVVAFEAGRDGFWLARWLRKKGIEPHGERTRVINRMRAVWSASASVSSTRNCARRGICLPVCAGPRVSRVDHHLGSLSKSGNTFRLSGSDFLKLFRLGSRRL